MGKYLDETGLSTILNAVGTKIPTKTSALENDSGYLSSVPSEYITEGDLEEHGFLDDSIFSWDPETETLTINIDV